MESGSSQTYRFQFKNGTLRVSPAQGNITTNFGFSIPVCFWDPNSWQSGRYQNHQVFFRV